MDLPSKTEGTGNAGRWPHPWPACNKKAGGSHHRFSRKHPAFPAQWLERLLRVLPGAPGFLATVIGTAHCEHQHRLDTSVGVSGPRDLTVHINVVRRHGEPRCNIDTPTASRLNVRDDREAPLM